MKIIQSLWTAPMASRWNVKYQLKKTLWSYAWSVISLRQTFNEVALHTDKIGKEIFGKLPYTQVHTTLDEIQNTPVKWWSYGKIKALENEDVNAVHVDGDVYLKQPVEGIFNINKADVIVQMSEVGTGFKGVYKPLYPLFTEALKRGDIVFPDKYEAAYNCGVLGFGTEDSRKIFLNTYNEWLSVIKDNSELLDFGSSDPNVVLEQYLLYFLAQESGWHVREVIPSEERNINMNAFACKIGYRHAWGKSKYTEAFQEKLKSKVKSHSKVLYDKLDLLCGTL